MGPGVRRDDTLKHFPEPTRLTSSVDLHIFDALLVGDAG
jgi:hypothetical protein